MRMLMVLALLLSGCSHVVKIPIQIPAKTADVDAYGGCLGALSRAMAINAGYAKILKGKATKVRPVIKIDPGVSEEQAQVSCTAALVVIGSLNTEYRHQVEGGRP